MTQTPIALSADYADALLTTRRAKNILFWILLLLIVTQVALFFTARYSSILPASASPIENSAIPKLFNQLHYAVGLTGLLALGTTLLLDIVLLLIVAIMLIGRLIGVARVVNAFIWAIILTLCLFPWQAFLSDGALAYEDFRLTGALFTWAELLRDARFNMEHTLDLPAQLLKWFRFAGFPLISLIILIIVQRRSTRGLRLALGETTINTIDENEAATSDPSM